MKVKRFLTNIELKKQFAEINSWVVHLSGSYCKVRAAKPRLDFSISPSDGADQFRHKMILCIYIFIGLKRSSWADLITILRICPSVGRGGPLSVWL